MRTPTVARRVAVGLVGVAVLFASASEAILTGRQEQAPQYARHFGYVTMPDGVRLAYVAYLPTEEGPFPAVLQYEPYTGAGLGPNRRWLGAGYAVVGVNVRGSGCSQGVFDLFGPNQGSDGAAIVDWIARQPWSDGNVGMIGGSYPGHTQILVAAEQPEALRAISPAAITASTYREIFYPGGIFNATFVSTWSLVLQPGAESRGIRARVGWGDTACEANYAAHPPSTLIERALEHPLYDDYWKARSLETYVDRVTVPTLVSQTWQDHQTEVSGATRLYEQLEAPKWLAMAPGGHGGVYRLEAFQASLVRFMDRWVRGVRNGVDDEPRVTVYWEPQRVDNRTVANWSTTHAEWPVSEAVARTFYLTADGALADTPPGDAEKLTYVYPIGTELIGSNDQFALRPDPLGSLSWATAALDADVTVLGSPRVRLFLASEHPDTDLVVALHDVYPNGDVQYLQRGFLRASLRRVDESRSTPEHLWHPFDRPEPLVPGEVYEIRLTLPALGAVLRAGHRLQMSLTAPSPIAQPNWGLVPVDLPGRNSVYLSKEYPSRMTVPVIPGANAQGPEPACGSMAYQPCRPAPARGGRGR